MAKFFGIVGYIATAETAPGVWRELPAVERKYVGDIIRNNRRLESGEHLNDDISLNNLISIMADAYAYENIMAIRYVSWMGSNWKVTNVEVHRPRLLLTLGGVYNGPYTP